MGDTTPPPPPPPARKSEEKVEAVRDDDRDGDRDEEDQEAAAGVAQPAAPTAEVPVAATVAAVAVAAPAQTGSTKRSPSDFLKTVLGRPVVVKLNSGIDYRGEEERRVHEGVRLLAFGFSNVCPQIFNLVFGFWPGH